MSGITAQFHGTCEECGGQIVPGQVIQADGDQWIHRDCGALPDKVVCVCEKCFLVHAGECL